MQFCKFIPFNFKFLVAKISGCFSAFKLSHSFFLFFLFFLKLKDLNFTGITHFNHFFLSSKKNTLASLFLTFQCLQCVRLDGAALGQILCFMVALASLPPAGPLSATRTPQSRLNGWEALWKTVAVLLPGCAPTSVSKAQHSDGYIEFRTRIFFFDFFFFKARQWQPLQLYLTLNAVLLSRERSSKLSPESGIQLITQKTLFIILYLNGHFENVPLWLCWMCGGVAECTSVAVNWDAGAPCLEGGEWPHGRGQDNRSHDEWTLPPLDGGARASDAQQPQH